MIREKVLVVGGGIIGLMISIKLQKSGLDVTLIDRSTPGQGTSIAALGSLTPYSDHNASAVTTALARKGLALYPEILNDILMHTGNRVNFDRTGLLELAYDPSDIERLSSYHAALTKGGVACKLLSIDEALEIEPHLSKNIVGGILYEEESMVDVEQLVPASLALAHRLGCTVVQNMEAIELIHIGESVVGAMTNVGPIYASFTVLTPGVDLDTIRGAPALPVIVNLVVA